MIERAVHACLALLVGAIALYLAVKLLASIAGVLLETLFITAVLVALGFVVGRLWRRHRINRW